MNRATVDGRLCTANYPMCMFTNGSSLFPCVGTLIGSVVSLEYTHGNGDLHLHEIGFLGMPAAEDRIGLARVD